MVTEDDKNNQQFMGEVPTAASSIFSDLELLGETGTNANILQNILSLNKEPFYLFKSSVASEQKRIHNPAIAFWRRANIYYSILDKAIHESRYQPFIEDYYLIISDLGMSLYSLFGRNWTQDTKSIYVRKHGSLRQDSPELMALIGRYYPKSLDWNLKEDDELLFKEIKDFIDKYYNDICKHFEYEKFEEALKIDFRGLSFFMEITRQLWFWFMEKKHKKIFKKDSSDPYFDDFKREYDPSWREYKN